MSNFWGAVQISDDLFSTSINDVQQAINRSLHALRGWRCRCFSPACRRRASFCGFRGRYLKFCSHRTVACGQAVVAVHPNAAGFQRIGNAQAAVDVGTPHCAAQAIFAVVRHFDDFFFGFEFNHGSNRAEDFFLGNAGVVAVGFNQGRFDKFAFAQRAFDFLTAGNDAAAFLFADF